MQLILFRVLLIALYINMFVNNEMRLHKCWLFANTENQYYAGVWPVPPQWCSTNGTVLIGSTGITLGLQPVRYRAGCKDWQYTLRKKN